MSIHTKILKKYWGYVQFRPLQAEIIESVFSGKDTLGLMPTGGGKSLTFQVPAMSMEGVCLVITPLIALMKDQVQNLLDRGIKAAAIYAGISREEVITILENSVFEAYKFLYVSPERLGTALFQEKLKQVKVSMIAVDESHCISQWGYDFRPSYLKISDLRETLVDVPVLALTATATPQVVEDIQERLSFREKNVFSKSFQRTNLAYVARKTEAKEEQLIRILTKIPGSSVVYVRNRKRTKEIADILNSKGISAAHFHAGLSNPTKDSRQAAWKSNEIRVIVSTNAFGMGIDKPDVRTVIHMDMPDSPEAYFQEAGRAGRDEQKAYAVMLFNQSDITKLKKRIADTFPPREFIVKIYEALCNFYQIGEGSGLESVFPFELEEFCRTFHLPMLMTHHGLKILEYSGYIDVSDEQDNLSRVLFLLKKDDLYTLRELPERDKLVHMLLRSYTGLFTEPAYIHEEVIAQRLGWKANEVYQELVQMSKEKIVHYIPRKKTPFIAFTHEREGLNRIQIPASAYEERKERFEEKIKKMIEYVSEDDICRSKMLLNYFGDKNLVDCGVCDVCVRKKESELTGIEFEKIKLKILEVLTSQPCKLQEVIRLSGFKEKKVTEVLRFLMDQGEVVQDAKMHLQIKKQRSG